MIVSRLTVMPRMIRLTIPAISSAMTSSSRDPMSAQSRKPMSCTSEAPLNADINSCMVTSMAACESSNLLSEAPPVPMKGIPR